MSSNSIRKLWRAGFGGGQSRFVLPPLILEIEPHFVVGARLEGSKRALRRIGMRELLPDTVAPLPSGVNISNLEELRRALLGVSQVIGNGTGRLGLLLPDGSVRVSILTFEALPEDRVEAETLVRWRMNESLSYPAEEATISCQVVWNEPGRVDLMVVAAKNSLLAEFEQALGLKNNGLELILPSTAALLPLLPETEGVGQLLVHLCCGWVTSVVVQGSRVRSWRTKTLGTTSSDELVKDLISEVTRVLASARDHLQMEVGTLRICVRPPAIPELAPELARAIGKEVQHLVPDTGIAATLSAAENSVFDSVGAPIAGLLANMV